MFGLGNVANISWARISAELDKCDLMCANCHMELEEELSGRISLQTSFNGRTLGRLPGDRGSNP